MRQVSNFVAITLSAAALAACGSDPHETSQSAVARNFEELAKAVAGCADSLAQCNRDAEDKAAREACQTEFFACEDRAGKDAENELVGAISECQEQATACRDEASDATRDRCATELRACIGEARARAANDSDDDAGAPGSKAPTYQCFGQLRECIAGDKAPRECAAEARECVLAAVKPADARRPTTKPPVDAGAGDAGRSGAGGPTMGAAGTGTAGTGTAGTGAAGSAAEAGTGGTAGGRSMMPGRAGTGGAGGAANEMERECMAAHQACLMSGEKAMTCAKDLRACMKMDEEQDEP